MIDEYSTPISHWITQQITYTLSVAADYYGAIAKLKGAAETWRSNLLQKPNKLASQPEPTQVFIPFLENTWYKN